MLYESPHFRLEADDHILTLWLDFRGRPGHTLTLPILHELNLPANARLIGAVGRLWPQKRLKDLIWAADLLKSTRDDTHLLIVGDGPQRWRLERYADDSAKRDDFNSISPVCQRGKSHV